MFWVAVAILYFVLAAVAPSILGLFVSRARSDFRTLALSLRIVFVGNCINLSRRNLLRPC